MDVILFLRIYTLFQPRYFAFIYNYFLKIYFDSIQSLDEKIYSKEQKRAWSSQAWNNPNFDKSIIKGKGWLISKQGIIIAFATRYPTDRIALFYCKGKFQRKGFGSLLLHKLEDEAKK